MATPAAGPDGRRGSASSARRARSPSRPCSPSPTWPRASWCRMPSIPDVLAATEAGEVDLGFVAIENAIEGTVNVTLDTLAFDADLLIQREVVISVQLNLLAVPGAALGRHPPGRVDPPRHRPVPAVPRRELPGVDGGGRQLHRRGGPAGGRASASAGIAAIGTALAGRALRPRRRCAADIEDHPENETRFVRRRADGGIPAPTGHDKTTHRRASSTPTGPGQPARHPPGVRGPGHQPDQARVAPDQAGPRATTASSSTSRATSPTSSWPTACATSRASRPT